MSVIFTVFIVLPSENCITFYNHLEQSTSQTFDGLHMEPSTIYLAHASCVNQDTHVTSHSSRNTMHNSTMDFGQKETKVIFNFGIRLHYMKTENSMKEGLPYSINL